MMLLRLLVKQRMQQEQFLTAARYVARALFGALLTRAATVARSQTRSHLANSTHLRLKSCVELFTKQRWQEAIVKGFFINVGSRLSHCIPDVTRTRLYSHQMARRLFAAITPRRWRGADVDDQAQPPAVLPLLQLLVDVPLITLSAVITAPLNCLNMINGLDFSDGYKSSIGRIFDGFAASGEMIWVRTQKVSRNPWKEPPLPPSRWVFIRRGLAYGTKKHVIASVVFGLASHRVIAEFITKRIIQPTVIPAHWESTHPNRFIWIRRAVQMSGVALAAVALESMIREGEHEPLAAVRYAMTDKAAAGWREVPWLSVLNVVSVVVQYWPVF